jgi:translocation and assembly module TamA
VSRFWDLSSGWQRAINLRWSLDHFTQANVTNTTMLLYPGVMISRTRSRGGLMPTWGDSQRYSIDYSNTMWGSDVDFSVMQAQNVWIRTLYDKHRFVMRGNLGWIETGDFDKVPPDLRFFAGGDRSIRGYKYKSISPKTMTAS